MKVKGIRNRRRLGNDERWSPAVKKERNRKKSLTFSLLAGSRNEEELGIEENDMVVKE